MNKMPLIISHYTKDTGYEEEVKNLRGSLERWGLEYELKGIESLGDWRRNSNYCSTHILEALKNNPDKDILRVDADAVIQALPTIFLQDDFVGDIAAHIHTFRWIENELMGGTLFFRNNEKVRELVEFWDYLINKSKPKLRPGDALKEIIESKRFEIVFQELPDTYCKIFDFMKYIKEPVIEHFQASRRFRTKVNSEARRKLNHG